MELTLIIKTVLSSLQDGSIPACIIGEIALNYYNVPRVVHDIEICVPKSLLREATSILCSTGRFRLVKKKEYDIYGEYKRGFPTLMTTDKDPLVVLFPDTYFFLCPVSHNIVSYEGIPHIVYSHEILDLVPTDEVQQLPMPYLAPFFVGLCRRFLESRDVMARIAAEQLVDGMRLDEEWAQINLSEASPEVRKLATMLISQRSSRDDEYFGSEELHAAAGFTKVVDLRLIPGSGYSQLQNPSMSSLDFNAV
ncbi:hypothetical protein C8Q69DRAFT_457207 [Paecilomyces variotii]|uniref:Uncharacterized protein n=1 Tax=Byssochlamys spectabilis TaxID=264951 RepID=A0A443I1I7_BYSSP|nr:hypothetical protein C8Q69DRAFT_457207 [Paecilomyces variotii]RWQ97930.1 hypothetical protein C8Q69DRAFT_457207 [Paecilomyces variotii]